MAKAVWNLKYIAGNPEMFTKVRNNASNPMKRSEALAAAEKIGNNQWRVWVEHHETGKRIYESDVEIAYRQKKRIWDEGVR